MTCDTLLCTRPVVFRTWRDTKIAAKVWCLVCFTKKVGKGYEMRVDRVK